jgi:peptide/nickel transport system substrate-binding protein
MTALHPMHGESPQFLTFLPLVALDEEGAWVPRLAESWEVSEDFREWTFHLRRDAVWEDGVPVTAHDVVFSLELLRHPEVAELSNSGFEEVRAIDDHTVVIRSRTFAIGHAIVWTVFYPRHVLEGLEPGAIASWDFWSHPIGNGPYRVARVLPQTLMELEASPSYFGPRPKIGRVVLKFVGVSAQMEVLSGQVDAANIERGLPRFIEDPRFRVHYRIVDDVAVMMFWNTQHPPLRDPRVRRALTLAVDRRGLLAGLGQPTELPLVDGPYTLRQIRRGELPAPLPHDPEKAISLLEQAGWSDSDGDGVRDRNGEPLRISVVTRVYSEEEALLVQSDLARVGVRLELQLVETMVAWSRVTSGDFEAVLSLGPMSPEYLESLFGPAGSTPLGNHRLNETLARLKEEGDPVRVDDLYAQLMESFREEQPITVLFPWSRPWIVSRRLRGLSTPWVADPVAYVDRLWLDP